MKKLQLILATVLIVSISGIYSCKKKDNQETVADDSSAQKEAAQDESMTQNESNQSMDDANNAMSSAGSINGRTVGLFDAICGGTVDKSDTANKKITVTYDGTTLCNGRTRSGSITIQLTNGTHWKDAGAKITVTFNSLKITRNDGKYIVITGTHIVENVNGGLVGVNETVVHNISGTITITFEDNTTRSWTVSRKTTIKSTGTGLIKQRSVKIEGTGADGLVLYGTNRKGESFSVKISTPIEANNLCGFNRPTAGVRTYASDKRSFTLTFGLDDKGTAVTSGCATNFRVDWKNAQGVAQSALLAY